ncbi:PP2C family protein-serine/threonine phosphatase [Streptosporangium sp. NPDC023615]|uniref:PP2C family protein-serine/threonine phosphatase n=1 Tax=Streptosporangium sp. NPDC023615 TaxID=3154794 RepID=UPI0034181466
MGGSAAVTASPGPERMLVGLLRAGHLAAWEQLPDLVAEHAASAGLEEVLIYLADLQHTVLRLLTGEGLSGGESACEEITELRVDATLAGRAFQEIRLLAGTETGGEGGEGGEGGDENVRRWWVPLLDGTERLGVLRVGVKDGSDAQGRDNMRDLASLVALLVVDKRPCSDSYACLVRTRPMHVAAEMQWTLMPPLTFADHRVSIAAALEPAYQVGGDAFDYALTGDVVHLEIFDAMGHDVSAGLTANLAVAACRNNRRQGADLATNSQAIEQTLITEFGQGTRFVTAILADLNTLTGVISWVNRGHHPPVVIRGGRWVTTLECPPAHPLGLDLGLPIMTCHTQLEPGDRVVFYSDGVTEARNAAGREFGLSRFVDFIIRHTADGLPAPETLRRLVRGVLNHHDGRLQDDATVLMLEWHGNARERVPPAGAAPESVIPALG